MRTWMRFCYSLFVVLLRQRYCGRSPYCTNKGGYFAKAITFTTRKIFITNCPKY